MEDAKTDPRFAENPLVESDPKLRFYAGAPLITPNGYRIGTVCIFDVKPRHDFGAAEREKLKDLAAIVSDHLEMRLIVGNVHDEIETRRQAEAEARRLALHDTLTGLPNRAFLQQVIADGLPFKVEGGLAALRVDIDHFKTVNDTLGHLAGDELLKRVADTIAGAVGEPSFVARVSGDEFVALVGAASRERISDAAATLVAAMKEPLVSHGHTISTGLSVGVAYADGPDTPIPGLLRHAALALDEAKRRGRRRVVTFNDAMATSVERRRRLEQDLTRALKKGEIEVEYQPIHRASDGAMIGAEALARWTHPELGPISPVEFVAVAEETGQILQLGERILRIALNDARDWDGVYVSVNLSPVQFRLADLAQQVGALLKEHAFPAPRLQLEVTEGRAPP